MNYFRTTALACSLTAAGLMAHTAASAQTVSSVEVDADLSAYQESNALEYWPTLSEDLSAAIGSLLQFGDAEDPSINVSIRKVAIDGDTILPDSGEFNTLTGQIVVRMGVDETVEKAVDDRESEVMQTFPLIVTAMTAEGRTVPEGWVLVPPSDDDFYNALISAYAIKVVERLDLE